MRSATLVLPAILLLTGVSSSGEAQTSADTLSLLGRSSISFGVGVAGTRKAEVGGGESRARTSGQLASLRFAHWVRPELAVEMSTGVLAAGASAGYGGVGSTATVPILFGVSLSPRTLALSAAIRPYLSVAAGPYVHMVSGTSVGGANAAVETAPGARAAIGAHWFVSRHFLMNVEGDYHAVGRLERLDERMASPSGFGMSVGLGFVWGLRP